MMKLLHNMIIWVSWFFLLHPTVSKFCSSHPNEVWVKGFFLMVPHEKHGNSISPVDDGIIREPYYLHLQQHPFLHYDYTHLHGCTYDVHLSHLKTHGFSCSTLGSFDVGGTSSNTWVKRDMIEEHYYWQQNPLLFHDDIHIHGPCIDETSLIHLKSSCFLCSLIGSYFGGAYSTQSTQEQDT